MLGELKLLESIELSNKLLATFSCDYTDDEKLAIVNEAGCYVLHLTPRKDNIFPQILFSKLFIPVSKYHLSTRLGLKFEGMLHPLSRDDLYEGILRTELSRSGEYYHPLDHTVLSAKWSPSGIVNYTSSILAVLSNVGSLEIYVKVQTDALKEKYVSFANITEQYIDIVNLNWKKPDVKSDMFNELKRRADQVRPVDFCWSKLIVKERSCCYLFVGYANGDITVWKIGEGNVWELQNLKFEFCAKYATNITNISCICVYNNNSDGLVIVGYLSGQIMSIPFSIDPENGTISFRESTFLYDVEDLVRVPKVCVSLNGGHMLVIAVKEPQLYIYLINSTGKVLDLCKFNTGNYIIADVRILTNNTIVVAIASGEIQEIIVSCVSGKINLKWKYIYVNLNWSFKRINGLYISSNKVLIGLVTTNSRVVLANKDITDVVLSVFANEAVDPEKLLENIGNNSFRNYWDCLELIRVKSLKEKTKPKILELEDYSDLPLNKLKVLSFLEKIVEITIDQSQYLEGIGIKSHDYIYKLLILKLALYRARTLLNSKEKGLGLSLFQYQSLNLLNNYMKSVILENQNDEFKMSKTFATELLDVIVRSNNLMYPEMPPCYFCKESGPTCLPYHYDTRCAVSLMQVNMFDYFVCPVCRCNIHSEIEKECSKLLCPYCEAPVDRLSMENQIPDENIK